MRGIDKVDVFRALRNQFLKNGNQAVIADLPALILMADFLILAVHTPQAAAAEKHGAAAVFAADTRFLPKVKRRARKTKSRRAFAKPCGRFSVNMALSGARLTNHNNAL